MNRKNATTTKIERIQVYFPKNYTSSFFLFFFFFSFLAPASKDLTETQPKG
jgi:hypothetical protein